MFSMIPPDLLYISAYFSLGGKKQSVYKRNNNELQFARPERKRKR
jgi:hypothetical protein